MITRISEDNFLMKEFEQSAPQGYFCTWLSQNYLSGKPEFATRGCDSPRDMINEKIVFGDGGLAYCMGESKRDLIFVFDDGWDVPYGTAFCGEAFGSLEVNKERFPFAVGTPAERLKALADRIKGIGWKGMGIWVAAQRCGADGQKPFCSADIEYWRERILWSKYAGVAYWKVDWGKNELNNEFRRFLTDAAAELYPELIVEQAICAPPFNGADNAEDAVRERFSDNKTLSDLSLEAVGFAEVFRTYDVSPPLSVATTLDRVAFLLPHARGYLNTEDELYLGAALGTQMGIMRTPFGKGADAWDDSYRLREADAALSWQKIAPPFAGGEVKTSETTLTDEYVFGDGEMWFEKVNGKRIKQTAPAVVARGCDLPDVTAGKNGVTPFVVAAYNPVGAYSVAVLPRTLDGLRRKYVGGEVFCKTDAEINKIAFFGNADKFTFESGRAIVNRITARSLFDGRTTDVSDCVIPTRKGFGIDGARLKLSCNADDESAPAVVFEIE